MGQLGGHNCSEDGYCTDQSNGFTCNCNPGFFGDGVNCTGIYSLSFLLLAMRLTVIDFCELFKTNFSKKIKILMNAKA